MVFLTTSGRKRWGASQFLPKLRELFFLKCHYLYLVFCGIMTPVIIKINMTNVDS